MISARIKSLYKDKEGNTVGVQLAYPDGKEADASLQDLVRAMAGNEVILSNARLSEDGKSLVAHRTGEIIG